MSVMSRDIGDRSTSGHRVLNECHVAEHRVLKELGSDIFHALEVIGAQLTQAHVRLVSRRGGTGRFGLPDAHGSGRFGLPGAHGSVRLGPVRSRWPGLETRPGPARATGHSPL